MASLSLSSSQKRTALLKARAELEKTIFAMGLGLGFDLSSQDLKFVSTNWCDVDGNPTIDLDSDQGRTCMHLARLCERHAQIVGKLEGPNRIV